MAFVACGVTSVEAANAPSWLAPRLHALVGVIASQFAGMIVGWVFKRVPS